MPKKKEKGRRGVAGRDKLKEILPPGREPIHQGQQFDEMQRQHKNPDNSTRPEDPRADHS